MFQSLSVDRFPFFIDVLHNSNEKFDDATVHEAYCCCRDKVFELSNVKALFRPLSEHETRKETGKSGTCRSSQRYV